MKFQLRRCSKCNRYTLREKCNICDSDTTSAHPARYSPDDKYIRYRLAEKYSKAD